MFSAYSVISLRCFVDPCSLRMLLIVGKIRKIQRAKRDEMVLFGDLFDNIGKIAFDRLDENAPKGIPRNIG